jgi:predicted nucleotidyltransferase component of viral defense system
MTEKERYIYQIMSEISGSDAPIVFKGAMVTKLILAENGYTDLDRQTRDIDANWVSETPTIDELVDIMNLSLGTLTNKIVAVAYREHGENMSAGISLRDRGTDAEIVSMDIDMRQIWGSRTYHYGEISFKGVYVNEILSDKITVLSDRMIFRRAKDLIDVYALAHCIKVNSAEIVEVIKNKPGREIGAFDEFLNRRQDIEHAYIKLRGVENKPPFEHVYLYLKDFLHPFITRDFSPRIWNSSTSSWDNASLD